MAFHLRQHAPAAPSHSLHIASPVIDPSNEPAGPDDSADPEPDHDRGESVRLEELGRVAAELLHDLADATDALRARIRLAAGEARMGRVPLLEMERASETAAEMGDAVRDVLEVVRGATLSPEVSFDPRAVAERTLRRTVADAGALDFRLVSRLPEGARIAGRESFLARALATLLANAARNARTQVRLTLALDTGEEGRTRVLATVEDDGRGIRLPPEAGLGLKAAEWSVRQLGGNVRFDRSASLGGASVELRLPCRLGRPAG
jgi:signal transduction histidine kinase